MNKQDAWNRFSATGSVADYLYYKAIEKEKTNTAEKKDENKDHRTDSKTTEYW